MKRIEFCLRVATEGCPLDGACEVDVQMWSGGVGNHLHAIGEEVGNGGGVFWHHMVRGVHVQGRREMGSKAARLAARWAACWIPSSGDYILRSRKIMRWLVLRSRAMSSSVGLQDPVYLPNFSSWHLIMRVYVGHDNEK